jgi:hypothetical protein
MMMFEAVGLPQTFIDECVAILNKRWDEKVHADIHTARYLFNSEYSEHKLSY